VNTAGAASALRWRAGAEAVRVRVARWLADPAQGELLRDNGRRALVRLHGDEGDLLVKSFRVGSAAHGARERWKAALGAGPIEREWRSLAAAHGRGVPVPEPLGLAAAGGEALLVLRHLEGAPLRDALERPARERRLLLRAVGRAVAALHAAGLAHGDLHLGNVLVTARGPVLLDLQRAGRARSARALVRDLASLDFSLWPHLSATDRLRLRRAALAGRRDARELERAVVRAARARARRHWRSRARHARRPGRRFERLAAGGGRGLCLAEFGASAARAALDEHRRLASDPTATGAALLASKPARSVSALAAGGRRVVVKEVRRPGLARALVDLVRGSAARRAWRAGYGLEARGLRAALPLAYVEERRLGFLPVRSALVLEDLRPMRPASDLDPASADAPELPAALCGLALRLHRLGVDHGDLKASHVFVGAGGRDLALIDLDRVRFRRRLRDQRRLRALAQLNASLPDELCAAEPRCRAFLRYAAALPFSGGARAREAALERVVRESLARRHRWRGVGCERAAQARPTSTHWK
jgi:tRNA A-37 threonylcarbamoyl transferase component Bud32